MNNDTLIILPIQIYMLNNTYLRINNKHALKLILNRNKKKIPTFIETALGRSKILNNSEH